MTNDKPVSKEADHIYPDSQLDVVIEDYNNQKVTDAYQDQGQFDGEK